MIYTGYFHWLWFYVFFMLLFSCRCCFLFILFYWNITSLLFHPDNSINKNAHLNMKKKKNGNKKRFHFIIFTLLLLRFLLMSVAINHLTWLLISFRSHCGKLNNKFGVRFFFSILHMLTTEKKKILFVFDLFKV